MRVFFGLFFFSHEKQKPPFRVAFVDMMTVLSLDYRGYGVRTYEETFMSPCGVSIIAQFLVPSNG
jgi:hypothetical protein